VRVLITGASGQLGSALSAVFPQALALDRQGLDLSDLGAVVKLMQSYAPQLILNAAAYTAVDKAEAESDVADLVNAKALEVLGAQALAIKALLVHWSTDYVFGGSHDNHGLAYHENDPTDPVNRYGASKLAGEKALAASGADYLIFRCSWVYGIEGQNFLKTMLRLGQQRDTVSVVADQWGVPTSASWLASSIHHLLQQYGLDRLKADRGLYHWVPAGETNWAAYASYAFECAGMPVEVKPIRSEEWPTPARRPLNSRLDCTKASKLWGLERPDWKEAVATCLKAIQTGSA